MEFFGKNLKENAARAKIAEASGEVVDSKIKLELLKHEENEIKLEKVETTPKPVSPVPSAKPAEIPVSKVPEKDFAAAQIAKETLVDKAAELKPETNDVLTPVEIKEINQIIENLPLNEQKSVKSEIEESIIIRFSGVKKPRGLKPR